MFFDEILGQEHLKQMIQSSLSNNSFPQSKIIVDKDGYGGLLFALAISERLLLEKGLKNSDVLNHPDLNFVFPLFSYHLFIIHFSPSPTNHPPQQT